LNKLNSPLKIFLIIVSVIFSKQETTKEIQYKIDNQSQELNKLRLEIEKIEERINNNKNEAINIKDILSELDSKIRLTEKLIRSLSKEEIILSSKIIETNENINVNKIELFALRENLSKQVQYLYKYGRSKPIEDLLTTKDLNTFYYKRKYLDVITNYQNIVSSKIDTIITQLELQKIELNEDLNRKKKIRNEKEHENKNLAYDKDLRKKYLKKNKSDIKTLSKKLNKQIKLAEEINNMIKLLIADKEKAKQREKELQKKRKNKSNLGDNYFASMKGKLDWPLNGKIISKFGPKYNKETKTWSENPGIDIEAVAGEYIYPVLDGLITTITFLRGYGNIIIIDHGGNYYSVYGNLENILVTENEYVDESMKLAAVASNLEKDTTLHFEVWGNFEKLNPEDWLK
tara:strand:+ start:1040 stop:2245 length:1206 start_codon:yes stop_codon:yes gene_type:complete